LQGWESRTYALMKIEIRCCKRFWFTLPKIRETWGLTGRTPFFSLAGYRETGERSVSPRISPISSGGKWESY